MKYLNYADVGKWVEVLEANEGSEEKESRKGRILAYDNSTQKLKVVFEPWELLIGAGHEWKGSPSEEVSYGLAEITDAPAHD